MPEAYRAPSAETGETPKVSWVTIPVGRCDAGSLRCAVRSVAQHGARATVIGGEKFSNGWSV